MLKSLIQSVAGTFGMELRRNWPPTVPPIPDGELYRPLFSPWFGRGEFARYYALAAPRSLVSPDRCYVLYTLLLQTIHLEGDVWECGVYKGGTAAMAAAMLDEKAAGKRLYLFDTFEGMPETDPEKDVHRKGDFSDTTVEAVVDYVGREHLVQVRKGFIPETFAGLELASIALAHIDVDIYQSILDSLHFIWPKVVLGGFVVLDDYGFPSCPGARAAVDEFFLKERSVPLCLHTGQAIVFKSTTEGQG